MRKIRTGKRIPAAVLACIISLGGTGNFGAARPVSAEEDKEEGLTVGYYVSEKSPSFIEIQEGGQFAYDRHIALNYLPQGNYAVEGEYVTFMTDVEMDEDTKEWYRFLKDGDDLVFEEAFSGAGTGERYVYCGTDRTAVRKKIDTMWKMQQFFDKLSMTDFHDFLLMKKAALQSASLSENQQNREMQRSEFSQNEPSVVRIYGETDPETAFEDDALVTMVRYYEMSDGTWRTDDYTYKYRLEITGRMGNAAKDSTFVFLSNIKDITFEQAWKASGLSSNMNDYFKEEDAKFVALKSITHD